ncbi:nitrogenase molybdenum-iron protein subunit beta [Candidatus Desantisbacteria bacterium]|nr:nitrogenase molybdenum-iron protein subunit beta [Candidatus Desantisbacteria bacterium]
MLDATPKKIANRKALRINPARTCQPIGALYASLGIHKCLPHSHGSQGCVSFHRMHLTRHFRDPILASTSSFTEGTSVFGGNANLEQAIKNIFHIYNPDIIAIHTTCLSETIGDDIPSILRNIKNVIPDGKYVMHANTPSYAGSHVTGFANMTTAFVKYFAEKGRTDFTNYINIIPGFMDPGDIREIKRILGLLKIPYNLFPDITNAVDSPMTGRFEFYPPGGTKIDTLKAAGSAAATICLGSFSSLPAGLELNTKCGVEPISLDMPIGIEATDRFVMKLLNLSGKKIPPSELIEERGRLVDLMTDTYFQYHGKRVAVFGDPDIVIPMTDFLLSLGMQPVYCLTGTPGDRFIREIKRKCEGTDIPGLQVESTGDLFLLHQWIKNEKVDLIIGNTYGKYISKAENIPLVRLGFPVLDRIAYPYFANTGYTGAMRLIEKISSALLDKQDTVSTDEDFELVM